MDRTLRHCACHVFPGGVTVKGAGEEAYSVLAGGEGKAHVCIAENAENVKGFTPLHSVNPDFHFASGYIDYIAAPAIGYSRWA